MKLVDWSQWDSSGYISTGRMTRKDVEKYLQMFEKEAAEVLKRTGADHVVYGRKLYDEDGELKEVRFYMIPMGDQKFQKEVASLTGCVIYALHRR